MVIENLSHVRCQNGAGRALRAVASIALAAASLVAPAAAYGAVSEQAEQNITFSIPTSLRCAVRADGTVIAPSGWLMSNSGSGKVEITGVSVSNAIGKLRLSGKSDSVGYAVGEGSGSYTVSYDAADGCKFSSTPNRPLGIESGKSLSWNWNIGKLNASDHRAALDSAASGRARLCDMSFSYAPVGNSLSSEGTTGLMSGTVDSQSSSIVPVGGTATANVGNAPSNATLSYQWYTVDSNDSYSAIANANGKTLKVLAAYRGKDIVCRVSDSSGHYSGYVETARKPVRNLVPKVGISGSAVYGSKLAAAASGLPSGATYTYKYKWQRLSGSSWIDIANATAAEYTLGGEDVGKQVRVIVSTASNIYTVDDVTAASATVAKAKASIGVSISGTKNNSSRLTASVSGLPAAGTNTVSYRWQRSSDGKSNWVDSTAGDAKSNSIQMQPNDVSWHYRCIVSASNPYYDIASSTSAAYGPIGKTNHFAPTVSVSGDKIVGATLTASVSGQPSGTTSTTYQWQRADAVNGTYVNISGATSKTYKTANADANKYVRVLVNTANTYYTVSQGVSAGYGAITLEAFAVYSADDNSLDFYKRGIPTIGETFNGKTATAVYTGIEKDTYKYYYTVPWHEYQSNITTSTIVDNGIAPISTAYWFYHCMSLTSVNLSKFDTSNVANMRNMFEYCSALISLDLSGWNTSKVTDMSDMFVGCSSLASVGNLSEWNTSNVTNMVYMFADCHALTSVGDLSRWDTSKVTDMASMFADCSTLTSLNFSGWDTSKVTNMNNMFLNCSKLQEITLGNNWKWIRTNSYGYLPAPNSQYIPGADGKWYAKSDGAAYAPADIPSNKADTYSATTPKEAFAVYSADDNSLDFYKRSTIPEVGKTFNGKTATAVYTGIEKDSYDAATIPWKQYQSNIATSTVVDDIAPTSTKCWFIGCGKITSINLNKLNTSRITTMANMFDRCYSLTSLNLSSLNTSNVISTSWMFNGCSALTSVGDLSGWNTSNLTNISYMFNGCSALTSIGDISGWNTSKVTSMEWMFNNCFKLTSVGTLSKWNTSKVASIDGIFYHCHALTSLNLSKWDLSNVTNMNGMFYNCYSLTSVGDLSGWNTSKVTNMSEMFDGCKSLTSVGNLSRWNTSKVTDMSAMFSFCDELISINLSGWDTFNVTNMRDMFKCCSSLTSIDGLSRLDVYKVTDMSDMFNYCSSLISLDLSGWKTSNVIYMEGMFYNCFKLASINGLSQWNTSNVMYMSSMFRECNKLVTDCSKWNVSKVKGHENFNYNAPEVIAPVWLYSDEITNEDFIAPLNRESKIENIGQEKSDNDKNLIDKENNAEEFQGTNNALTEQNNQNDDVDN